MLYQRKIISVAWGIVYSVGCYQKKKHFHARDLQPVYTATIFSKFNLDIYIHRGGFYVYGCLWILKICDFVKCKIWL